MKWAIEIIIMLNKFKQTSGIILIMLLSVLLIIAVLYIWEVIDVPMVREVFWKTASTFGLTYIIFLVIIFISKKATPDQS